MSLQQLVDRTIEHGSVLLSQGVYSEQLMILRPLTIEGSHSSIIASKGPTIKVFAAGTVLKNLKLGVYGEAGGDAAPLVLMLKQDSVITLENVEIHGRVCDHLGQPAVLEEVTENNFVIALTDAVQAVADGTRVQPAGLEAEPDQPMSIQSEAKERSKLPIAKLAVAASFALVLGLAAFAFRGGSADRPGTMEHGGAQQSDSILSQVPSEAHASINTVPPAGNPHYIHGRDNAMKEVDQATSPHEKPIVGSTGDQQLTQPEPARVRRIRLTDGTIFQARMTKESKDLYRFNLYASAVERAVFLPERDMLKLKSGGEIKGKIVAYHDDYYGIVVSASEVGTID